MSTTETPGVSWPPRSSIPESFFDYVERDALWEPTDNDLPPTEPRPGDYELPEWDGWDEDANRHVALMGGWCAHHPDRPEGGRIVGAYFPA